MNKAWGDNFYDEENKKWSTEAESVNGEIRKRGFVKFIIEPICELTRAIAKNDQKVYESMIEKLKIALSQ